MMRRKFDIDQLRAAVHASTTRAEVLVRLGLKPAGGNYMMLKAVVAEHGLDISHFKGQGWRRGGTFPPRRAIEEYLQEGVKANSHELRLRLIREGLFKAMCYGCERSIWLDQPIPLELEHKNGIHNDNRLENLTLLCPNCHALTPTYRSRNRAKPAEADQRSRKLAKRERAKTNACVICGAACLAKYCSGSCAHQGQRKAERPSREELAALVETTSLLAIGRRYGVSDNAVRKWLRAYDLR